MTVIELFTELERIKTRFRLYEISIIVRNKILCLDIFINKNERLEYTTDNKDKKMTLKNMLLDCESKINDYIVDSKLNETRHD